jgi:enterochelin esterase family protein
MRHAVVKRAATLGVLATFMLTGCQTGANSAMETTSTEVQTYEVKSVPIVQAVDTNIVPGLNNAYADIDFSTPDDFYYKYTNINYGSIDDNIMYYSSTIGEYKKCGVLLPDGYNKAQQYPVIYLLHGFGGDHYDWNRGDSYVQDIYGNLLAKGKAVPAIIVMPDMYTAPDATKANASRADMRVAYDNFMNDLKTDLMPYIESHYMVKKDRADTAIIGTSQGGMEALAIGFNMQDRFGYIGSLAPAPGAIPTNIYPGTYWNTPVLDDFTIKDVSNTPYYIQLAAGNQDSLCLESTKYYEKVLTQNKIAHTYYLLGGAGHEDAVWENGIYNFLKRVFK